MNAAARGLARFVRMLVPLGLPLALTLALALIAPFAGDVAGDHGGRPIGALFACDRPVTPPRCTSVADDRRHLVFFDETLTESLASSLRDTMVEDYGAGGLIMTEQQSLTRLTDVIAFSQDYCDNGAAGWVYCPRDAPQGINSSGDRWCRQQELHLNLNPRYAVFFADDPSRDHVTCHELGHTVGLRHWGNPPQTSGPEVAATCMNANTPNGPTVLHQFDIDHMNAYGYRHVPHAPPSRHRLVQAPADPEPNRLLSWTGDLQATEVEDPASLRELTRSSDAVVRGEIISIVPGRVFGDPDGDHLHYASVTLRVDDLLAGSLAPPNEALLTLEIPLFDGPASIATLPAWGESIFFLRNKVDPEFYRLLSFDGLVVNVDGVALTASDAPLLADLSGTPFDEVVETIRNLGR
ncbi:MAG: hypothetical protein ABIZ57_02195 [Candidatus Limnocylindria bacterium]